MPLSPGQAFGNYRILSRIGVGGMGVVFLAEHPHIGKRVALKIIHRDLAGSREAVSRFLNEARAVNQIGSEHIVQIHDFGQTDSGEHFFIMEYLEGHTLADVLGSGALEVPRALHVGAQIASALAATHDANIIHRDLKPDNVMLIHRLGDPDFVKLLDFGLAKFLIDAGSRQLTAVGVVLGTPHYMSPEACECRPDLDARCDIYSLGVVLYQMLTGQLPFTGDSLGEVLVKQVGQQPPPPRAINPNVPPAVEALVLRCLAKAPAMRFQSMREVRDGLLDPAVYGGGAQPVPPAAASPAALFPQGGPEVERGRPGPARPPEPKRRSPSAPSAIAGFLLAPPASFADGVRVLFPQVSTDAPTETELGPDAGRGAAASAAPGHRPPTPAAPTTSAVDAVHRPHGGHERATVLAPAENQAMESGARHGPTRPPWRVWPRVALVVVAGAAAGAMALWVVRPQLLRGGRPATADEQGPDSRPDRWLSELSTAHIRLTTRPSGAEVTDATGKHVGTTPTVIALPMDGSEVVLRFRHPLAEDFEKRFVASGDAAFDVELPPARVLPVSASAAGGSREPAPRAVRKAPRPLDRVPPGRRKNARPDILRPDL